MRSPLAAGLAFSLAIGPIAAAQVRDVAGPPPTGTGVIFGRVTSSEPGARPLRRVMVSANGPVIRHSKTTVTDDDGRYVIDALPDDHYTVTASKVAYVTTWAGARPGDALPQPAVDIVNGQRAQADIVMTRGGVITGMVIEPSGRPRPNQNVNALSVRMLNGKRSASRGINGGSAVTDDRGQFRIFGLAPGDYVLSTGSQFAGASTAPTVTDEELKWARLQLAAASTGASTSGSTPAGPPPAARAVGYSPVYYPSATDLASATIVTVGSGEERDGMEIVLASVPLAKIEGTITNADGSIPPQVQLTLSGQSLNGAQSGAFGTMARPASRDGAFTFPNLQPGTYTLIARLSGPVGGRAVGAGAGPGGARLPTTYARADVDINGQDVSGVQLVLQPTLSISGRITVDPAAQGSIDVARVQPSLSPVTPMGISFGTPAVVAPDGSFTISEIIPNQFRLNIGDEPPGWGVKSATVNGADFLDAPLTIAPGQNISGVSIVLTNHLASLSGKLVDGAGKGLPYTLILFSTDRSMWSNRSRRTQTTRAKATGEYAFNGLAAGEYYFIALSDPQAVDLTDPDSFEVLAGSASKLTLAEGEKKQQSFTIKTGG